VTGVQTCALPIFSLNPEPDERQQRLSQSPLMTEASTLVDPVEDPIKDPIEAEETRPKNPPADPTGFVPLADTDNPFALNFEELAEETPQGDGPAQSFSSDESSTSETSRNESSSDESSSDEPPSDKSFSDKSTTELPTEPLARTPSVNLSPKPPSISQKPEVHSSRSSPDSPPVDPELAASLNISKPRSSKRKSRQTPTPSSGSPTERAKQWKPLKASRQIEFWLSYGWTAIALTALLSILI